MSRMVRTLRVESLRHLLLGLERTLALEDALGVLVLLHGAVVQPGLRAEMGMAIEIAHVDAVVRSRLPGPRPVQPVTGYFFS